MNQSIPTLDLNRFQSDREAFVAELEAGYREFGFVGFVNHGISDETVAQAYAVFKEFFALPKAVKEAYHRPGQGGARGYTGFGVEQAKDNDVPDLKEFWHIGREVEGNNPHPDVLLPNLWPQQVPGFKAHGYGLYQALDDLGGTILSAIALSLDLPEDWFADKTDLGNSILRPIHYPPIIDRETPAVRAAQHEDINLITLLLGSSEQGLEILTRGGQWIPVTTIPGTIVVNIGDMLQRLTNHYYPSTTHRVINPPGMKADEPRYSIPFFLHPNPDFEIRTLPQCISEDEPNRYPEPILAHDYLMERLREIKLA